MRTFFAAIGVGGVLAVGAATAATAMPVATGVAAAARTDVTDVGYRHRRHHLYVYGPNVPRVPPHLRGFNDPGYAYHGNINGCAVDLGYGRWESCNVGR